MPDVHEEIVLHLRPLPDDVLIAVRLRFVLKRLLRDHRFRCTKVEWRGLTDAIEEYLEDA